MPKPKIDRYVKKAITDAKNMIHDIYKDDVNEAETRRRLERIFETLMGYDAFKHITREHAIRGVGDTEHCDFAIQMENSSKPYILVELKRVGVDVSQKHLKQVASYGINIGCEWVILTNSRQWSLYHISFGQPPQTKLLDSWNLLEDTPEVLAEKFELIGLKSVKRGDLDVLWQKRNVLNPKNLLKIMLSESALNMFRRELKKSTGVVLTYEEIVNAIRRLLNESAAIEMDGIKISLPESTPAKRSRKPQTAKKTATKPIEELLADVNMGEQDQA